MQTILFRAKEEQIQKLLQDNEIAEHDKVQFKAEIEVLDVQIKELDVKIEELGRKLVELQKQRDLVNEQLLNAETEKNKATSNLEKIVEQVIHLYQ